MECQRASKDINEYIRTVRPSNLIYDLQLKGYRPTADFKPQVTEGLADEYLVDPEKYTTI